MLEAAVALAAALHVTPVAPAQSARTGCTTPLAECTKARVTQLKAQSRTLAAAARQKPGRNVDERGRAELARYDDWLREQSRKTHDLAARGATAKQPEAQMSFNLQYLRLQAQMQHENRSYTAISNIMKSKHDAVKNSIANVR